MRKTIMVLALVAASVAAASAGARQTTTTFTFCTDPSFPPMEFVGTNGGIRGFDVEMASALAKTFGATAKPLKTAFPGLIPALNAKKCVAVISGIFVTPDRLKQAGAVDYMETHRVFIVKAGNPKHVTGPNASLKGLSVVVFPPAPADPAAAADTTSASIRIVLRIAPPPSLPVILDPIPKGRRARVNRAQLEADECRKRRVRS